MLVMADPKRIVELASLARDEDWLVSMRALDLLEKLAHLDATMVQPFKELFIGPLADSDKWEIRLQIVRALPLLSWTPEERGRVVEILRRDIDHPQTFVRAWALDGLCRMVGDDVALRRLVLRYARAFEQSGSKALAARARDIRGRLAGARAAAVSSIGPYVALPPSGRGPGVLVLHPWWGLTRGVREICDRLAQEGFVAIAPDLYGGKLAHTEQEARELRSAPRAEPMYRTISHALDALLAHKATQSRRVGVVGLSMGGHWALWFASRPKSPIAAVAVFYAVRAATFTHGPNAAFQFHLAEQDNFVSLTGLTRMQKALRTAGRRSEMWVYPGTRHWFFEPDRPEHDAKAAALAWTRMLAFLRRETA